MVSAFEQPQVSRAKLAVGLLIVGIAHVGYIFLTYRARVLTRSAFWSHYTLPWLISFSLDELKWRHRAMLRAMALHDRAT